ncbi:MAG: hypothetical protein QM621_11310 [Aeromicrobium sp.]
MGGAFAFAFAFAEKLGLPELAAAAAGVFALTPRGSRRVPRESPS